MYADSAVDRRADVVRGSCHLPVYPVAMREEGISGRVVLAFIIGTDGRVESNSFRVVSATYPDFVNTAIFSARSCRFRPAEKNGLLVRVQVEMPINYRVDAR